MAETKKTKIEKTMQKKISDNKVSPEVLEKYQNML